LHIAISLHAKPIRKLILLLLSGMLSTACVDKDYDLGNIDTDNIAIGDEGSQFRIPLVKVLVSKDEIKNNGGNIEEIFREADIWFPSQLPDGKFVDLVKLQDKDDQTYVNTLLRTLREEMRASDAKLASVVDLVWDKYAAEFLLLLNLTAPDEQTFKTAFKTAYRNDASLRERLPPPTGGGGRRGCPGTSAPTKKGAANRRIAAGTALKMKVKYKYIARLFDKSLRASACSPPRPLPPLTAHRSTVPIHP